MRAAPQTIMVSSSLCWEKVNLGTETLCVTFGQSNGPAVLNNNIRDTERIIRACSVDYIFIMTSASFLSQLQNHHFRGCDQWDGEQFTKGGPCFWYKILCLCCLCFPSLWMTAAHIIIWNNLLSQMKWWWVKICLGVYLPEASRFWLTTEIPGKASHSLVL